MGIGKLSGKPDEMLGDGGGGGRGGRRTILLVASCYRNQDELR